MPLPPLLLLLSQAHLQPLHLRQQRPSVLLPRTLYDLGQTFA